jgi:transglutaminase-like putative cysteine protease
MPRPARRLRITHATHYRYERPVARSIQKVHLRPITDSKQTVLSHALHIDQPHVAVEYEDVFGNWLTRFELGQPYEHLTITATSEVEVLDVNPFAFAKVPARPQFPLVWMPWEQTMLGPYLKPFELADTQLQALYDYAMGFVTRNNGDLMETLFAINLELFRNYKYVPGTTTLGTTAFEVFQTRRGVCQDFANLFITMARLLGLPARYVCGYVYTGNHAEARAQSDASHAWLQLYIPRIGWKGFDPTNGVLPHVDHVRVGYGRHWRDTAPTSGTLYGANAGREQMDVDVTVVDVTGEHLAAEPTGAVHPSSMIATDRT